MPVDSLSQNLLVSNIRGKNLDMHKIFLWKEKYIVCLKNINIYDLPVGFSWKSSLDKRSFRRIRSIENSFLEF